MTMRKKERPGRPGRRRVVLAGALGLGGAAGLGLGGCTHVGAEVWSVSFGIAPAPPAMLPWPGESRLGHEPGAETLAGFAAAALPAAAARVAAWHELAFLAPPMVLVFADQARFARYSLLPPGPVPVAVARENAVHLSPALAEAGKGVVAGILAHELAHLLLHQRLGLRGTGRLPPWFLEGIAVEASGGAGAEAASEAEALRALRQGRRFSPEEANGFLEMPRTAAAHGISNALFYRQAGLFIRWLRRREPRRFIALLHRIAAGEPLGSAFPMALGMPLVAAWGDFLSSLA